MQRKLERLGEQREYSSWGVSHEIYFLYRSLLSNFPYLFAGPLVLRKQSSDVNLAKYLSFFDSKTSCSDSFYSMSGAFVGNIVGLSPNSGIQRLGRRGPARSPPSVQVVCGETGDIVVDLFFLFFLLLF